jgi:hypothetical protein
MDQHLRNKPVNLRFNILINLLFVIFTAFYSLLPSSLPAQSPPSIQARRTSIPPKIDGSLDDPVWQQASPCEEFFQREPIEGAPASEKTEVRILYDDGFLYFGCRCFDSEPRRIVANRMRRDDELEENDSIQIILDTYNDRRGGFFFSTNPLGAMWDVLLSDEGRSHNKAWNTVWQCRARRDEAGWTAEFAIPFDQLRYAESDDAVWGINIARTIPRKNEEVFLAPPPQSYGFGGQYRTSKLAELRGLGALRPRPRLEILPYVQIGSERDFEALDPTEQRKLDTGVDLKYGLTPSLTLDLSYKTDFAQVEADQEQVNLTRFSLFFPEKRGFFLEGAGIFEFGERRRGFGGPPPTLLFYSRRIGLQEGHNLPVIFGSKLTGRAGAYEIGLLNLTTGKDTFIDEVEEERFVTDAGEFLDEDDPRLEESIILDTLDVDVIDTLRVERTNFSVFRLRRDILERSNIGIIAINRDPGEETDYNRSLGADFNLSLLQSAMNIRGFGAKTWSPDLRGEDYGGQLSFDYRTGIFETSASYLDIGENFDPEVGFVPRSDIRRYNVSGRYRPLGRHPWIRRYSFGPQLSYLTDRNGVLQTRDIEISLFVNLEVGDWIGLRYRHRFERLDESFEIHDDIEIPVDDYSFGGLGLNLFSNESRRISVRGSAEAGNFFGGTRARFFTNVGFKLSHCLAVEVDYEINRVDLPQGDFLTNGLGNRFIYSFNPDLYVRGFVQWNSKNEVVGGNFLINYKYHPGSDIYLVYNQVWDTEDGLDQQQHSVQFKTTYFWNR